MGSSSGVNFNGPNSFGNGPIFCTNNALMVLAAVANDTAGNTGATGPISLINPVTVSAQNLILVGIPAAPVTYMGNWTLAASGTSTITTQIPGGGAGFTNTISGAISGGAVLSKAGASTLVLSGANTYSGGTTISAGILSANAVADSGTSAICTGCTLNLSGGTFHYSGAGAASTSLAVTLTVASTVDLPAGDLTLNGATKSGVITKSSGGTLTLGGSADNASLGVTITGGKVGAEQSQCFQCACLGRRDNNQWRHDPSVERHW